MLKKTTALVAIYFRARSTRLFSDVQKTTHPISAEMVIRSK